MRLGKSGLKRITPSPTVCMSSGLSAVLRLVFLELLQHCNQISLDGPPR